MILGKIIKVLYILNMVDYNFESNDSSWGDQFSNESNWDEAQWRNYLKITEKDSARFLSIYNTIKDKKNHLDEAAHLMGWDEDDISLIDDEKDSNFHELEDSFITENENSHFSHPYTLHKHPVFIVTKSLYKYINQSWGSFLKDNNCDVSALLSWNFSKSLHDGEINVLLAIQSLDFGDFGLAICHLKNSLFEINKSIKILHELSQEETQIIKDFTKELMIRIFDLRELWIRVINDCRHESKRKRDNTDSE